MSELTPDTAKAWLHEAQDLDISHERASEIVKLINPVVGFARKAAGAVRFDGEPGNFIVTLRAWSAKQE